MRFKWLVHRLGPAGAEARLLLGPSGSVSSLTPCSFQHAEGPPQAERLLHGSSLAGTHSSLAGAGARVGAREVAAGDAAVFRDARQL